VKWYDFLLSKESNTNRIEKFILRVFRWYLEPRLNQAYDNGTYYVEGKILLEKFDREKTKKEVKE